VLTRTCTGASFTPRPEVDAAVVTFVPRSVPLIQQPFELVEKVVRQLFHYRQKYSVRGYADLYPKEIRREMAHEVFSQ
jgi:dimethyladenosine transferase 1